MSTASQKINAYLCAGIPILLSNSKDMKNFKLLYNCSLTTSIQPKQIAKKIKYFFNQESNYRKLKKNAIRTHRKIFNFENQFQKLKKYI